MASPQPTEGKIVFADGTPLRGGIVTFKPIEVKTGSKLRYETCSLVNEEGYFKIGFNRDDKGAASGEYKVVIAPRDLDELPKSNSGSIPTDYRDERTTPIKVTVRDGNNKFDLTIK